MAYPETQQGKKRTSEFNSEVSGRYVNHARYVLRNNFTPEGQQYPDRCLAVMAERIQARAIRRGGELLKQIEPGDKYTRFGHDATDMPITRTEAATQAGLSERQKVTMLRVANVPAPEFNTLVESEKPPTVTKLAEQGKTAKPVPLHTLDGIDQKPYTNAGR